MRSRDITGTFSGILFSGKLKLALENCPIGEHIFFGNGDSTEKVFEMWGGSFQLDFSGEASTM